MYMDVIYSYTCHESPDAFIDTLRNLIYYNTGLNIAIIVHCNPYMYAELTRLAVNLAAPVLLNNIITNKRMYTFDIIKAQCENILFCHDRGIKARYFVPLASNCYFHKHVTRELLHEYTSTPVPDIVPGIQPKSGWSGWQHLVCNPAMLAKLESDIGLRQDMYYCQSHEGQILEYVAAVKMAQCVIDLPVERETMFEESIIASVYCCLTGKAPRLSLNHIFWNRWPSVVPSIEDILSCEVPCVKRVSRNYGDPIRVWQRSLTGDYAGTTM